MGLSLRRGLVSALFAAGLAVGVADAQSTAVNPAPTAKDWAALGKLPDWSGVWTPDITGQVREIRANPTPWTPQALAKIRQQMAEEAQGHPRGLFIDCLPEGMPSWMLISHNALEILFTPGRVTLLGESDGDRLRRIYTDGRGHSADPDPTFHGESIGHWEGQTLVVDTIGVLPESLIAVSESVGLPNNGDLHVVERIHLQGPDNLVDDIEITAPHVLTGPWKTTRRYFRQRARKYEIVEGVCLQGFFKETVSPDGDNVFKPRPMKDGNPVPES